MSDESKVIKEEVVSDSYQGQVKIVVKSQEFGVQCFNVIPNSTADELLRHYTEINKCDGTKLMFYTKFLFSPRVPVPGWQQFPPHAKGKLTPYLLEVGPIIQDYDGSFTLISMSGSTSGELPKVITLVTKGTEIQSV